MFARASIRKLEQSHDKESKREEKTEKEKEKKRRN